MADKKQAKTYSQLNDELDQIISWFESDKVDLDNAISKYQQAIELISQIEDHLKTAENKIKKISKDLQ